MKIHEYIHNPGVTNFVSTAFMNAVGTEWVMPGLPRMMNAVGTEWVTPGLPRMMNAVGTEWVTPGLPRMTYCMHIVIVQCDIPVLVHIMASYKFIMKHCLRRG